MNGKVYLVLWVCCACRSQRITSLIGPGLYGRPAITWPSNWFGFIYLNGCHRAMKNLSLADLEIDPYFHFCLFHLNQVDKQMPVGEMQPTMGSW